MKAIYLILIPLLVSSCATNPEYYTQNFDDGIFEVTYVSKEGESADVASDKYQLLVAYTAETKGCDYYKIYRKVSNSGQSSRKSGFWLPKYQFRQLYQCASESEYHQNEAEQRAVKQVIQIQESRYGSMRELIK